MSYGRALPILSGVPGGLGYQLPAAFRAAPCQYLAAILRRHACTEPMRALAAYLAGLISALHGLQLQVQVHVG